MIDIREYQDARNHSPFRDWFNRLTPDAARRITSAVYRLGLGNFSNVKGVGAGVFEYRIDAGPGYRVYFGKDGDRLVILPGGGSKRRQSADITVAIERWQEYKRRKQKELAEEN